MIDAFKAAGSSPPKSVNRRRDVWLAIAAVIAPWITAIVLGWWFR